MMLSVVVGLMVGGRIEVRRTSARETRVASENRIQSSRRVLVVGVGVVYLRLKMMGIFDREIGVVEVVDSGFEKCFCVNDIYIYNIMLVGRGDHQNAGE